MKTIMMLLAALFLTSYNPIATAFANEAPSLEEIQTYREQNVENLGEKETILDTPLKEYIVGEDVIAGRYIITSTAPAYFNLLDEAHRRGGFQSQFGPQLLIASDNGAMYQTFITLDLVEGQRVGFRGEGELILTPAAALEAPLGALSSGEWVVGIDILPGRYEITPENVAVFSVYNPENELVFTQDFAQSPELSAVDSATLDLNEGDHLFINYTDQLNFEMIETREKLTVIGTGIWEVGVDIEPGEYVFSTKDDFVIVAVHKPGEDTEPIINAISGEAESFKEGLEITLTEGDMVRIQDANEVQLEKQ